MSDKNRTFLGPLVALSLIILAVVAFLWARQQFGPDSPGARPVSSVPIGGAFTLVDQDGKTVTDKDFLGAYALVYFGYTYCPDVCPTSLTAVGQALDAVQAKAPAKAAKIRPVFITVDPERDTPAVMKDYVTHFHPRLVGLTGTLDQVAGAAQAYRVYFAKVREKDAKADEYLMDHSSITYVIGPDGKFVTHFGHGTQPDVMAEKLAALP